MIYLLIIPALCFFILLILFYRNRKQYKYSFEEIEELIHQYENKLEKIANEDLEFFRLEEKTALGCSLFRMTLWYNFERNKNFSKNKRYNELYDEYYKREKDGIYFLLYFMFCFLLMFLTVFFLGYLGVLK